MVGAVGDKWSGDAESCQWPLSQIWAKKIKIFTFSDFLRRKILFFGEITQHVLLRDFFF
jgi:hypothetical protein